MPGTEEQSEFLGQTGDFFGKETWSVTYGTRGHDEEMIKKWVWSFLNSTIWIGGKVATTIY